MDFVYSRLLDGVNLLLEEVGLRKRFATVDQLQTTACSMFVAIYEKLFGQLSDIDRNSRAYQSLLDNTEILLHHLRDEVGAHLEIPAAITAELVVSGDIPSIRFLAALFRELKALRDRASELPTRPAQTKRKSSKLRKRRGRRKPKRAARRFEVTGVIDVDRRLRPASVDGQSAHDDYGLDDAADSVELSHSTLSSMNRSDDAYGIDHDSNDADDIAFQDVHQTHYAISPVGESIDNRAGIPPGAAWTQPTQAEKSAGLQRTAEAHLTPPNADHAPAREAHSADCVPVVPAAFSTHVQPDDVTTTEWYPPPPSPAMRAIEGNDPSRPLTRRGGARMRESDIVSNEPDQCNWRQQLHGDSDIWAGGASSSNLSPPADSSDAQRDQIMTSSHSPTSRLETQRPSPIDVDSQGEAEQLRYRDMTGVERIMSPRTGGETPAGTFEAQFGEQDSEGLPASDAASDLSEDEIPNAENVDIRKSLRRSPAASETSEAELAARLQAAMHAQQERLAAQVSARANSQAFAARNESPITRGNVDADLDEIDVGRGSENAAGAHAGDGAAADIWNAQDDVKHAEERAAAFKRRREHSAARLRTKMQTKQTQLELALRSAAKQRAVEARVHEARFKKRAALRARAALHDQKVATIRTRRFVNEVRRTTLSLSLRRASKQTAAMQRLIRAAAEEQKQTVLDKMRYTTEYVRAAVGHQEQLAEASMHEANLKLELLQEQSKTRARERSLALEARSLMAQRARRDLTAYERDTVAAATENLDQFEAKWIAQNVDAFDPQEQLGGRCSATHVLARAAEDSRNQQNRNRPTRPHTAPAQRSRISGPRTARRKWKLQQVARIYGCVQG